MAIDNHKAVLVVANKIDKGEELIPECRSTFRAQMEKVFHFYSDVPVVFTSAVTGKGIKGMFEAIADMKRKLEIKIPTSKLNDFFVRVIRQAPAPLSGTKTVKFYYLTQTQQRPPSFIAFANFPEVVDNSYRRFLINRIKSEFGLEGIPIRIFVMKKRRS
jgi:GTP-binding protein